MGIKPTLTTKGIAVICVPCVIQLVLCASYWQLFEQINRLTKHDYESKVVLGHMNWLVYLIATNALLQVQDKVRANPKDVLYLKNFRKALTMELADLQVLFAEEPQQLARVQQVGRLVSTVLPEAGVSVEQLFSPTGVASIWTDVASIRHAVLETQREKYSVNPTLLPRVRTIILATLAASAVLSIVSLFVLVGLYTRYITRRLNVLADNTVRFQTHRPLNPIMAGNDELAALDRTFHRMVEIVTEAASKERAIVEYAVAVIFSLDSEARFVAINPAAINILGYSPEKLSGTSALMLAVDNEYELFSQELYLAIQGRNLSNFEAKLRKSDGTEIDTLWGTHWSESEQLLFCVVHDITERKNAERLQQEVLSMVSHDIRSPLTAVHCTLQMLHSQFQSDEERKLLERALRSSDHIMRLVNDLIDAERIKAKSLALDRSSFEVAVLLDECVESVRVWSAERNVDVVAENCRGLMLNADRNRMAQVIVNLLSNAAKFSPEHDVVMVSASRFEDSVVIKVIDHGPGIPEHLQSRIFERFKQVGPSDAANRHGAGLGLTICKALVELHNGTIGVESRPGLGSTFIVRIPQAESESAGPDAL